MEKYLSTAIVPVFNTDSNTLLRFYDSIKNAPDNIQIIIVDDGSDNKTALLLDSFESDNIRVIHKKNGGVSSARNLGLQYANGKYIQFIDSDDTILPSFFTELSALAEKFNADVLISDITVMPLGKTEATGFEKNKPMSGQELINSDCNPFKSFDLCYSVRMCFRKDLIINNNILFNEEMTISEDFVFNINALQHSKRAVAVDGSFYEYWLNGDNSATRMPYNKGFLQSFAIQYDECKKIAVSEMLKNKLAEFYLDFVFYNLIRNQKQGNLLSFAEYKKLCEKPMFRESIVRLGQNHSCENKKAQLLYRLRWARLYFLPYITAVK